MPASPAWTRRVLNPTWYHGYYARPPFFEGWYYKMVTPDQRARYAIIPGIFLSDDPSKQHAFVQVFDGVSGRATYHRYPADQFQAARERFDVRIGANHFTEDHLTLNIDDNLRRVAADLRFEGLTPYPVTRFSPGIMGPFAWLPFMECYHGIVSLDHLVSGEFTDDDNRIDFGGGRGYIEKDWGQSFPAGWVWMQTNHFETLGTSLTASIAITPMLGSWFPGFIAALWHNGTLYRFTTYTGARTERLEIGDQTVLWVMRGLRHRLEIYAQRANAADLPGPTRHDMEMRVPETLNGAIRVCLTSLDDTRLPIFEGEGVCAGLEIAGDTERLRAAVDTSVKGT